MVCDSQNLKTIPENIVSVDHEVVTSASFANNSIELTESLELLNFQHLQELILKENVIEELPRGFFREMQALRKLDLSHNRLTSISNGDFNLLVNLRHLDLSHNHLTNVADEAFIHLVKLESLDLSSNKLYSLAIEDLAAAGADGDLLGVDSRRAAAPHCEGLAAARLPVSEDRRIETKRRALHKCRDALLVQNLARLPGAIHPVKAVHLRRHIRVAPPDTSGN